MVSKDRTELQARQSLHSARNSKESEGSQTGDDSECCVGAGSTSRKERAKVVDVEALLVKVWF